MDMKAIKWIRRKRGIEKGRFFKTKVLMSVRMRLFDLHKGKELTSWTEGSTRELADDGLVIEVNRIMVDGFHVFTDAMKKGRGLELEWELPADGGSMAGKGKVLWFKMAPIGSPYLFAAGVLLAEMGAEHRGRWLEFTRSLPG
jgi:hypothetical protein